MFSGIGVVVVSNWLLCMMLMLLLLGWLLFGEVRV